jgi:hypothetical protein
MSKRQKLEELFADRHFDGDVIILCAMSPRRKRSSAGQSNIKASHRARRILSVASRGARDEGRRLAA